MMRKARTTQSAEEPATQSRLSNRERDSRWSIPEPEIPFSLGEYRSRLDRIRGEMERRNVQLLFLSAPESLYYVSGYRAEWYQAQSPKIWPPSSGIAISVNRRFYR